MEIMGMRNWILRDHSDDTLIEAIERNVIEQNIYFASKHPHMEVVVEEDFILVDTHTSSYLCNCIFTIRFIPEDIKEKVEKALNYFKEKNRSFLWIIGPTTDEPEFSKILKDFGLERIKKSYCMMINLSHFKKKPRYIRGFHLQQVLSKRSLEDFKNVMNRCFNMKGDMEDYFHKLGHLTFHTSDSKKLFVGYLDEKPVIVSELYLGAGIAGLTVNIDKGCESYTRDLIIDVCAKMLSYAKHQGYHFAMIKAPKEHCYFYNQLGFRNYCRFYYYQW